MRDRFHGTDSRGGLYEGNDGYEQAPGRQTLTMNLQPPVQRRAAAKGAQGEQDEQESEPTPHPEPGEVHEIAAAGVSGTGGALPHLEAIQSAFGRHDVSGVQAYSDGAATKAAGSIGAMAYASGEKIAFGGAPDLHTAAHEAAHVVQQRAGVSLPGGVGSEGDAHERHADAVADAVVRGESAEALLDELGGGSGEPAVQAKGRAGSALSPGDALAHQFVQKKTQPVQLKTSNGVSVSGMRFSPKEIKADGATTAQATVQYSGRVSGSAKINWSLEGNVYGSTISADGLITPGNNTVPAGKDKVQVAVKAADSKEAAASTEGRITLWDPKYLQAKEDYPKFLAATYKGVPALGKFDLTYSPASRRAVAEMKLEYKWFDDNPLNPKDKWTPARKSAYQKKFAAQARSAWARKFSFDNVREPKSIWGKLGPVALDLKLTPVAAGGHFVVEAHRHTDQPHPSDPDQWSSRAALHGGTTLKVMQGNEKRDPSFRTGEVIAGEQARMDRVNPGSIAFKADDAALAANAKLDAFATYAKRINHPRFIMTVEGTAGPTDTVADKKGLSSRRAKAVQAYLRSQGMPQHPVSARGLGDKGASEAKVTAVVDPKFKSNPFDVLPHEFGHMLGLGDEYPYAVGDKKAPSDHHALVQEHFGKDYADQVAQQADDPSANIMFYGNDVRVQDYVTFWSALGDATSSAAVPAPPFTRTDWKIRG